MTIALSTVRLPENSPLLRAFPLPETRRFDGYELGYDRRTLVYDSFDVGARRVLICPRWLNLWRHLRVTVDGQPVRPKRRRFNRYEELWLPQGFVQLQLDDQQFEVPPSTTPDIFDGKRCVTTMVKDLPVEWIAAWLRWLAHSQGTQAAVIYANNDARPADTLQADLRAAVPEVDTYVASVPLPYGTVAGGKLVAPSMMLQVALLNVARLRCFPRAAGVLSLDVDEMPLPDADLYGRAARHPLGLISFPGQWVYGKDAGALPQAAHGFTANPASLCNPKWAAIPGRRAAKSPWMVHRPGGLLAPLTRLRTPLFWHCAQTSIRGSRQAPPQPLVPLPDLSALS